MAKPPDGESSWRHTSDTWFVHNADGSTFVQVSLDLNGSKCGVAFPVLHRPGDSFYAIRVQVEHGRLRWYFYHPSLPESPRECWWNASSSPADLLPRSDVHQLKRFEDYHEGAPVVATMEVNARGHVQIFDHARCRIELGLGKLPDAPGCRMAYLRHGGRVLATIAGAEPIAVGATSLP